MRAITGAVVSSETCSVNKAARLLGIFYRSAASQLPADCATFLLTAANATRDHELFRRGLRANLQQGAANLKSHDYEADINHQDRKGAVPVRRDSSADVGLDVAAGEKKSKKKKKDKEDLQEVRGIPGIESHIPSPKEIAGKKRKKEEHSIQDISLHVKQEPDLVADEEELLSEKKSKKKKEKARVKLEEEAMDVDLVVDEELVSEKKSKKKKEKARVKLEEEAMDVDEVGSKIVNGGGLVQNVVSGEKKRKKKKHEEEEVNSKDLKEEKMISDGDRDSEKKRKKKRGRGDNDDNALEQVEHTKKKQRK